MLFIMFCEFYYLLGWATLGVSLRGEELPAVFRAIPWIFAGALAFFALWLAYFRGAIAPGSRLRDRPLYHAFRQARVWHYAGIVALRSPALGAGLATFVTAPSAGAAVSTVTGGALAGAGPEAPEAGAPLCAGGAKAP